MRVRLNVKLAEVVEGVDLSSYAEGDILDLDEQDARLLILGGWAEVVSNEARVNRTPALRSDIAADGPDELA